MAKRMANVALPEFSDPLLLDISFSIFLNREFHIFTLPSNNGAMLSLIADSDTLSNHSNCKMIISLIIGLISSLSSLRIMISLLLHLLSSISFILACLHLRINSRHGQEQIAKNMNSGSMLESGTGSPRRSMRKTIDP